MKIIIIMINARLIEELSVVGSRQLPFSSFLIMSCSEVLLKGSCRREMRLE